MKLFGGFCFFLGLFYQKVAKGELLGGQRACCEGEIIEK